MKAADVREQVFTLLKKIYPWSQPVLDDAIGGWPCCIKMQDSRRGCSLGLSFADVTLVSTHWREVLCIEIYAIYSDGKSRVLATGSDYIRANGAIKTKKNGT